MLNETKIYQILLERFGEPISKTIATVGIPDERHMVEADQAICDACGTVADELVPAVGVSGKMLCYDCATGHDQDMNESDRSLRRWFVYNIETGTDLGEYEASSKEDALKQFQSDLEPGEELDPNVDAITRDEDQSQEKFYGEPGTLSTHKWDSKKSKFVKK